ncbi:MAG: hypothetical protein ABWX74_12105, partial [Aeromicrobium sp.]
AGFEYRGGGGGGGGFFGGGGGGDNRYYGAGGGGGSSLVPAGGATDLADPGVAGELAITYDLGPVTQLQVNVQDATIPASDRASTTVSAKAKTDAGQPVAGLDVSFVSSDPGQAFGPVTDERDGMLISVSDVSQPRDGETTSKRQVRYRTVGDMSCTGAVESDAVTVEDVIVEVAATRITERGATRADDRASEAAMEDRKKEGYF